MSAHILKCLRCKKEFSTDHFLDLVCAFCLEEKPQLSSEEKSAMNIWDSVDSFYPIYQKMKNREWVWFKNMNCKYIDLRIDMRDGGCILHDRSGNRISFEQLAWQYSSEEPDPIE